MKLLLTSAGITNTSIRVALLDLLGRPIAECRALLISTASYPLRGGPELAWNFIAGEEPRTPMAELGWRSVGVLELTALPSIDRPTWQAAVQDADVLLVNGGDARVTPDGIEIDPRAGDETRIDRWLCAVRLVKTRPLATRLCEGGHVLVNGSAAKPSTKVHAGDRVEAFIAERERVVEVIRPIESRVGAPVAATCYVDHSPPVVAEAGREIKLIRGEGRPNKRLRRELERLRRAADA